MRRAGDGAAEHRTRVRIESVGDLADSPRVTEVEVLEALLALTRESGLEVRTVGAAGGGEVPPTSGTCRVRGEVWVVLSRADPIEAQSAALADALRRHAGDFLESRYLPPALRARIGAAPDRNA